MPQITIGVDGVAQTIGRLNRIAGTSWLVRPMERSVALLQRRLAEYPEQRMGSAYRRTGTLGRRWTTIVRRSNTDVVGTVGNNTRYAPFVQSSRFQAGIHRGRWQTDAQVLERSRQQIEAQFEAAARRVTA